MTIRAETGPAADIIESQARRISELTKALRDLVDAEEEYGDPDNVAVNEAWDKARRVLDE